MSEETTTSVDTATSAASAAEPATAATEETTQATAQPGSPDPTRDHDGAQGQAEEGRGDDAQQPAPAEHDYSGLRAGDGVSADRIASVIEFAKGEGLPTEVAQKLLDRDVSTIQAEHERLVKSLEDQRSQWQEEVKSDPEVGGDMLPVTRRRIDGFVGKFDKDGSLRALLDEYGYIDHPAVVKFFARAAEAFEPGRVAPGHSSASAPKTAAEVMYGSQ